jgi:hypothetical protein
VNQALKADIMPRFIRIFANSRGIFLATTQYFGR